jgi:SPX domain protein involved in polyphosphate accumulation
MNEAIFQRWELKYLVNERQRAALEQAFCGRMTPDFHGESTVCNIYYDTPDFRLIRQSLDKPVYKEKLRMRSYGPAAADQTVFLELKKKYQGIVYKRRIEIRQDAAVKFLSGDAPLPVDSQIGREIAYALKFYGNLAPAVHLSYDRQAFFAADDPAVRVTFDRNICWRAEELSLTAQPGGEDLLRPCQSLMEIKTGSAIPLWLVELLDAQGIRQTTFSKYGRAYESILNEKNQLKGSVICA